MTDLQQILDRMNAQDEAHRAMDKKITSIHEALVGNAYHEDGVLPRLKNVERQSQSNHETIKKARWTLTTIAALITVAFNAAAFWLEHNLFKTHNP